MPCPADKHHTNTKTRKGPCLCDDYPAGTHASGQHGKVTRIAVQDWRAEERIRAALSALVNDRCTVCGGPCARCTDHEPRRGTWMMITEGDPRGYVLRVIPPSYAERNQGKDRHNRESIGVPAGPSRLRF